MLENALPLRDAFSHLMQLDRDYKNNLSSKEWVMGDVIYKCLMIPQKKFGIKYSTANTFFFDVCIIYTKLVTWKNNPHDYVCAIEEKMITKFRKYWDECSLVLIVAGVFDPRYKLELIKFYYKTIYASDAENMISKVCTVAYDLYSEYVVGSTFESSMDFVDNNTHDTLEPLIEAKDCLEFDNWYAASSHNSTSSHKLELDMYLGEPLVPRDKKFNVLQWWRFNPKFPTFLKLVRDLLVILVSTVASESLFKTGGWVLDQNHNCFALETVLICAQIG